MDIKHLRTFLSVAQLGSLTRAAAQLHLAQPAVGRQVQILEEDLGVRLFDRHGRGMALTEKGQLLVERATSILRMVEETRAELSTEPGAVKGIVSLGAPPTAGEVLAGRLVERFLRDHPEATVRIVPAFTGYLLDMLERGEIDLAVMYETGLNRHVPSAPLIAENLFLVGPPGAGLTLDAPESFSALAGYPLILPGPRHGLRTLMENEAQSAGVSLSVAVEADALQTLKDLVMRRLGYTVLPLAAVHNDLQSGALCAAPIAEPPLTRNLVLARSSVRPETSIVRVFADTLVRETTDMVKSGVWQGQLLWEDGPDARRSA